MNKYEGKNSTKEEQAKIIRAEVIPLAKSIGFDFSTEDFQELLQPAIEQLTDEELDEAVGGKMSFRTSNGRIHTCNFLSEYDFSAFTSRFYFVGTCPDYVHSEYGIGPDLHWCGCCKCYELTVLTA